MTPGSGARGLGVGVGASWPLPRRRLASKRSTVGSKPRALPHPTCPLPLPLPLPSPQDLEYLIEKCVDIEKADYAVVTGIQARITAPAPAPRSCIRPALPCGSGWRASSRPAVP